MDFYYVASYRLFTNGQINWKINLVCGRGKNLYHLQHVVSNKHARAEGESYI